MKAIINTFAKSDLAHLNGLTFDVVGHCNNHFEIDIGDLIVDIEIDECLIVDITSEFKHAKIRYDRNIYDYWYEILRRYLKVNKIKFSLTEIPKEKLKREIESDNFTTLLDEQILNETNHVGTNDGISTTGEAEI